MEPAGGMTETPPHAPPHPASARLWLCLDRAALDARSMLARARAILENVDHEFTVALWLRGLSSVPTAEALALALDARALAHASHAPLVVGERADLALLARADGLHVTGRSPDATELSRFFEGRADPPIALSAPVHDPAEVDARAPACAVLLASPFGPVPEKGPPLGPAGLTALLARAPARTFVALGGIDDARSATEALAAGAHALAVRRPILHPDPLARLASVLHALRSAPVP
jgi:thiamine monophosphate synthase